VALVPVLSLGESYRGGDRLLRNYDQGIFVTTELVNGPPEDSFQNAAGRITYPADGATGFNREPPSE
jgi:hypothetical protein